MKFRFFGSTAYVLTTEPSLLAFQKVVFISVTLEILGFRVKFQIIKFGTFSIHVHL